MMQAVQAPSVLSFVHAYDANAYRRFLPDPGNMTIHTGGEAALFLMTGAGVVPDEDMAAGLLDAYREAGDRSIVGARVVSRSEPWIVMEGGIEWDEREMTWVPARYAE